MSFPDSYHEHKILFHAQSTWLGGGVVSSLLGFNSLPMAKSEVLTEDEKTVLEAFNRFDADGSGSISREELGQVLKSLDPEGWDKDSIDQVLADADASGDGSLQIKEFIRWDGGIMVSWQSHGP